MEYGLFSAVVIISAYSYILKTSNFRRLFDSPAPSAGGVGITILRIQALLQAEET